MECSVWGFFMSFQMEKFQKSIYNSNNTFPLTKSASVRYEGHNLITRFCVIRYLRNKILHFQSYLLLKLLEMLDLPLTNKLKIPKVKSHVSLLRKLLLWCAIITWPAYLNFYVCGAMTSHLGMYFWHSRVHTIIPFH